MVFINTELFKNNASPQISTGGIGSIKPIQGTAPTKGTSQRMTIKPPTAGSKFLGGIGNVLSKGINLLNKPSEWTEKALAPALFGKGVSTYAQGAEQKWGMSPKASQFVELGGQMLLDPLNLLMIGGVSEGMAKIAGKVLEPAQKFGKVALEALGKTKVGEELAGKFMAANIAPRLMPEVAERAGEVLKSTPKTIEEYRKFVKYGIDARMKMSNSSADIMGVIKKITGKRLGDLNIDELTSLYKDVREGMGITPRVIQVARPTQKTTEAGLIGGQEVLPGIIKDLGEKSTWAKKVQIPTYLKSNLEDMIHAASIDKDIGFFDKYLRPIYQTIEKYDKGGVLKRVYGKLSVANDNYEKFTRVIDNFRAVNYGKLAEPARNMVFDILSKADSAEQIRTVGKTMGATTDIISAAVNSRARFDELIDAANAMRKQRGLTEIPKIKNYVTNLIDVRLLDSMSDVDEVARVAKLGGNKMYHLDRELSGLINEGIVSPKVNSPYLRKRVLTNASDLDILKTKDIDKIMSAYSYSIGKDIFLGSAIDTSKPLLKLLPADLQKLTNDMIEFGIKRRWTPTDITLSKTFGGLNFRNLAGAYGGATYRGGLGFNMRSPLQNFSQQVLTYSQVGLDNMIQGYKHLMNPDTLDKSLMNLSEIMRNRKTESGFAIGWGEGGLKQIITELKKATLPGNKIQKAGEIADRLGMGFFNFSEQTNVAQAYLAGCYKQIKKYGGIENVVNNPSRLARVSAEGDRVAKITQFSYRRMDVPPAMWSALGRLVFQYQTYPINLLYYLKNLQGADKWGRLAAGSNVVNKVFQELLGYSPFDWSNLITRGSDYGGYSLAGSPITQQLATGVNAAAMNLSPTATEKQKTAANKKFLQKMKIMIPYELGIERLVKLGKGELTPGGVFGRVESPKQIVDWGGLLQKQNTVQPRM